MSTKTVQSHADKYAHALGKGDYAAAESRLDAIEAWVSARRREVVAQRSAARDVLGEIRDDSARAVQRQMDAMAKPPACSYPGCLMPADHGPLSPLTSAPHIVPQDIRLQEKRAADNAGPVQGITFDKPVSEARANAAMDALSNPMLLDGPMPTPAQMAHIRNDSLRDVMGLVLDKAQMLLGTGKADVVDALLDLTGPIARLTTTESK